MTGPGTLRPHAAHPRHARPGLHRDRRTGVVGVARPPARASTCRRPRFATCWRSSKRWVYVWQPHTSAGRVPTDAGYRCYVDMLLEGRRALKDSVGRRGALAGRKPATRPLMDDLLSSTSHVLSEASQHVGFAIAPPNAQALFHRIEFVPLSGTPHAGRGGRERQPGVAEDRRHRRVACRTSELVQAANFLNAEFSGCTLDEVRDGVVERLHEPSARCTTSCWASRCASPAARSANLDRPTAVYIDGASTLLDEVVRRAASRPRPCAALLRMVEEKQRLVRMLTEYIDGPGLTVVIGAEHSDPELRPLQPDRFHLLRRAQHRHGGRDWSHADAILEGHHRGRHRSPGGRARAARL